MNSKRYIASACLVLGLCCPAQEPGAPIFADSFDTKDTFAENWVSRGNVKSADGRAEFIGGDMTLRQELPPEFFVECDVTMEHDMKKPAGFGGMMIGPFRFQVKPEGVSFLLWNEIGSKQSKGAYLKIDNFELGRPVRTAVARTVKGDIATYTYFINGKKIGSFKANLPEKDKNGKLPGVFFTAWRVDKMYVDNFRLSTVKKSADESPNLTVNSSFETLQEGFPLYVTRQSTADFTLGKNLDYEKYISTVTADDKEKHSGNYSLKIVNNELTQGQSISLHSTGTVLDQPGVISLWMKSDRDDMKVSVGYGYGAKQTLLTVGKEWKRYEAVNPKLGKPFVYSPAWINIPRDSKGTLWVDDVQTELLEKAPAPEELKSGKTFATAYRPSELDKIKLVPGDKPERAPSFSIPKLPASVRPGIALDSWKNHAVKLDKFHFGANAPRLKTEAYLACDDDNLYLAYRNSGEDFSLSKPGSRDTFALFTNGTECFFDPSGNGEKSVHFANNAAGARCDLGFGDDVAWNGDWKTEAVKNEKDVSVDYLLTFPLSNFAGSDIDSRWLVNVCRNDGVYRENLSIARIPTVGYRKNDYWPEANLPEAVIRKYALGAVSAVSSESASGNTLTLLLRNLTGTDRKVKVSVIDLAAADKPVAEKETLLKQGDSNVVFPVSSLLKRIGVRITDADGKLIFNRHLATEKRNPVSLLGRLSFYMNEPEAVFKVTLNLPDAEKLTAVLECAGKKITAKASPSFTMTLPIRDLKPGTYEANLTLFDGNKPAGSAKDKLIKREFWEGAAQINRFSRSVMKNGKSVFPVMLFFVYPRHVPDQSILGQADWMQKYGFNAAHILMDNRAKDKCQLFMAEAEKRNMPVIFWTKYDEIPEAEWPEWMKKLNYKNILSQMVMDEPELNTPSDKARDVLRKMKPLFPYHPVHMNNTVLGIPNNFANLETDLLMLDNYLTASERQKVKAVVDHADLLWKAGEEEGKPCYYFLVGGNFPLHYREPSYGEQIAQSYGSIAAGCTGLAYFYGWPQTAPNWRACVQIAAEVAVLNDVLTDEEECLEAAATGNPKYLRHRTKKHDGYLYVVSANIDENPAGKITFALPSGYRYSGDVEVMFENRKLNLKNGKFTDDFSGYSRHVYKVKMR